MCSVKKVFSEISQNSQENTCARAFILTKKIFCRRKLYSAGMENGQNMAEHISHIKTLSEHLEAIDNRTAEKDLVILLISSLHEEYNYLITALETIAEDHLTWDYVRDRLIHESEKKKSCEAEKSKDAIFVSKPDKNSVKCYYRKKSWDYARDCYKKKKT